MLPFKESELIRLLRGAWGFAVLLCRFFFVCGVAVNKIPRCGVAVISNRTVCGVLILKLRCSVTKIPSRCCSLLFDTFDRLTRTLVGLVELSKPIYIRQTVLCNFLGKKGVTKSVKSVSGTSSSDTGRRGVICDEAKISLPNERVASICCRNYYELDPPTYNRVDLVTII